MSVARQYILTRDGFSGLPVPQGQYTSFAPMGFNSKGVTFKQLWDTLPLDVQKMATLYASRKQIPNAPAGFTALTTFAYPNSQGGFWSYNNNTKPIGIQVSFVLKAPDGSDSGYGPVSSFVDLAGVLKDLAFNDRSHGFSTLKNAFRSAVKLALKPVVYVATAPLQLTKPTAKIASKINTAILNNPLTAAGILAVATGVTLATAPAAGAGAVPPPTPPIPPAPPVPPSIIGAGTTAAKSIIPEVVKSVISSAGTIIQAGGALAPVVLPFIGGGGGGGAPPSDQIPAPVAPAAAPGVASYVIPIGIGLLALFMLNQ